MNIENIITKILNLDMTYLIIYRRRPFEKRYGYEYIVVNPIEYLERIVQCRSYVLLWIQVVTYNQA